MRARSILAVVSAAAVFGSHLRAQSAPVASGRAEPIAVPIAVPIATPIATPIVVLVSLDGFRWDFLQKPVAKNLRALAARGVRAERLVPAFPSKTYPNHYTLVTGLYPEHHGIVANTMLDSALGAFATGNDPAAHDGRWYGGEPIWVTAERQGMRSAPFMWPGGDTEIGGVRATYTFVYDSTVSRAARVDTALALLALHGTRAPRFVTLYFENVDGAAHRHGPNDPRTDAAVAAVDSTIGAIVKGISRLGLAGRVNLIVVSDHGMTPVSPARTIYLDDYVAMDSLRMIDWSPVGAIMPKPGAEQYVYSRLKGASPHLSVYWKRDVPARLHFNSSPRITPIVAIADEGWTISSHAHNETYDWAANKGNHGFDNAAASMGAIFVAAGPAFKPGVVVPAFQNIHVYPLIAAILGLTPARGDGSLDSVRAMLRR